MDCAHVVSLRTPFVDGELEQEVAQEIEAHLRACASCRAAIELERTIVRAVHAQTPAHTPAYLHERILINTSRAPDGLLPRLQDWLQWFRQGPVPSLSLAVVAVVAVVATGISIGHHQRYHQDVPEASFAMLTGEIRCLDCTLKQQWQANANCRTYGHRNGLIAHDGTIWAFVNSGRWAPYLTDTSLWGRRIVVEGRTFSKAHYVDAVAIRILEAGEAAIAPDREIAPQGFVELAAAR